MGGVEEVAVVVVETVVVIVVEVVFAMGEEVVVVVVEVVAVEVVVTAARLGKETGKPRKPPGAVNAPPSSALAKDRVSLLAKDTPVMPEKERTTRGLEGATGQGVVGVLVDRCSS